MLPFANGDDVHLPSPSFTIAFARDFGDKACVRESSVAKYKVLRRVDAFVDYIAEVEADDAHAAAALAASKEENYAWKRTDLAEYDARSFVTLDADGFEIDGTQKGDF